MRPEILRQNLPSHVDPAVAMTMMPSALYQALVECPHLARFWSIREPAPEMKDSYLPALTCVWQSASDQQIFLGSYLAADNLSVLEAHGIKAKVCCVGTVHGHPWKLCSISPLYGTCIAIMMVSVGVAILLQVCIALSW